MQKQRKYSSDAAYTLYTWWRHNWEFQVSTKFSQSLTLKLDQYTALWRLRICQILQEAKIKKREFFTEISPMLNTLQQERLYQTAYVVRLR